MTQFPSIYRDVLAETNQNLHQNPMINHPSFGQTMQQKPMGPYPHQQGTYKITHLNPFSYYTYYSYITFIYILFNPTYLVCTKHNLSPQPVCTGRISNRSQRRIPGSLVLTIPRRY